MGLRDHAPLLSYPPLKEIRRIMDSGKSGKADPRRALQSVYSHLGVCQDHLDTLELSLSEARSELAKKDAQPKSQRTTQKRKPSAAPEREEGSA